MKSQFEFVRMQKKRPPSLGEPHPKKVKTEKKETRVFSNVQMKLATCLRYNPIRDQFYILLNNVTENLTNMMYEAYFVCNFHYIKCLSQGLEPPPLYHTFFDNCCNGVTEAKHKSKLFPGLQESIDECRSCRPSLGYVTYKSTNMSDLRKNLSKQMETSCKNHITRNFVPRLIRHCRLKYHLEDEYQVRQFINGAFYDAPAMLVDDQKEVRDWLEFNPLNDEDVIKNNLSHFVKKLYDMLKYMEDEVPVDTKGRRTFSIMPLKSNMSAIHVLISESNLPTLLQLLPFEAKMKLVKEVYNRIPEDDEMAQCILLEKMTQDKFEFTTVMFANETIRHTMWRVLFDVKSQETVNRTFGYYVSTNGYEISMRYLKQSKGTAEETEFDSMPLNPEEYYAIGIDPGQKYMATAYSGVEKTTHDGKRKSIICQISTKEYQDMAKITAAKQWELRQRTLHKEEYGNVIEHMPSFKTANLNKFKDGLGRALAVSEGLMRFCRDHPFRKWRFKKHIYQRKAMHRLAKRLVESAPNNNHQVLIGFGDWSKQDNGVLKGNSFAPVKGFRRELKKFAKVVEIDEYRTSKTCSGCMETNANPIKKKKEEGESKTKLNRQVVRCNSSACSKCWQRDVNGARNIFHLLKCQMKGTERPFIFTRAYTAEEKKVKKQKRNLTRTL